MVHKYAEELGYPDDLRDAWLQIVVALKRDMESCKIHTIIGVGLIILGNWMPQKYIDKMHKKSV